MIMASSGIKRKAISIDTKVQIISAVDEGKLSKTAIAEQFGIKKNSLSTILKNRSQIVSAHDGHALSPARKKIRYGKHDDIDEALLKWFISVP